LYKKQKLVFQCALLLNKLLIVTLKNKIKNSSLTIGSWISSGSLIIADIMSKSGLDWIALDNEHSTMSYETMHALMVQIQANNCQCFVRVGSNDALIIKKCLDAGANGIIVPMIKSLDDAKTAVAHCYYPPVGSRGVGLSRAQEYGFGFENYLKTHTEEVVLILQVEHVDALKDLEKMAQLPEVDGFIVGPYDLSASLGIPGNFEHQTFKDALVEIESKVKKNKKALGVHVIQPEHTQVLEKNKKGYNFIAFSLDFLLLGTKLRAELESIKNS